MKFNSRLLVLAGLLAATLPWPLAAQSAPGDKPGTVAARGKGTTDPVLVQENVLRFADGYLTRVVVGLERLAAGPEGIDRAKVLKWKIGLASETCSIATGPNSYANLLDMVVFVTVTRMTLEEQWQQRAAVASAEPLITSCRNAEAEVWQLAAAILTANQLAELHTAVDSWRAQNQLPEDLLAARALSYTDRIAEADRSGKSKSLPSSVFALLRVDPLAGIDPAVREISQTRLLAERALFLTQKMPIIVRWQIELLGLNASDLPAVQQLVANSTRISNTADRFANVAEKLPAQISNERAELLKGLEAQEKELTPLAGEVRQALTALNTAVISTDALMKRFGVGEPRPPGPAKPPGEPFRIQDYTAMAAQLEATARQLNQLVVSLNQTAAPDNLSRLSAQVAPAVQAAQTSGKAVVDYAFWKGVLLVVVILAAALLYRFIVPYLQAKARAKSGAA